MGDDDVQRGKRGFNNILSKEKPVEKSNYGCTAKQID